MFPRQYIPHLPALSRNFMGVSSSLAHFQLSWPITSHFRSYSTAIIIFPRLAGFSFLFFFFQTFLSFVFLLFVLSFFYHGTVQSPIKVKKDPLVRISCYSQHFGTTTPNTLPSPTSGRIQCYQNRYNIGVKSLSDYLEGNFASMSNWMISYYTISPLFHLSPIVLSLFSRPVVLLFLIALTLFSFPAFSHCATVPLISGIHSSVSFVWGCFV